MYALPNRRIQLITLLIAAFAVLFAFTPTVRADNDVMQGSSIASGETVENDVVLSGTDVALNGTVDGDALIVGWNIVINGDVTGSLIILGQNVVMNGEVEGSVYAVTETFKQVADAVIGRSLYYVGVSLVTDEESTVSRDIKAVTLGINQAGDIGRDKRIISGLEIFSLLLDRVNALTTGQTSSLAPQDSSSLLPQVVQTNLLAGSIGAVGSSPRAAAAQDEPAGDNGSATTAPAAFGDWLIGRLRELVTYLLIGGALIWLFPRYLDKWANQVRQKPLAAGGWGLVTYMMGFIAAVIFFLLILVIGISFAAVTLGSLAWAWWAVGFSALALSFSLFLVAIAFISKIILAYLFGRLLFLRFGSTIPDMRKPWPLLFGLIIYVLLSGVPFLGWAISLIVTFLGLGGMWLAFTGPNEGQQIVTEG